MSDWWKFLSEHCQLTRRFFMRMGIAGGAAAAIWPAVARSEPRPSAVAEAIAKLKPYFTPLDKFGDVSRGEPVPHSLSEEMAPIAAADDWRKWRRSR